MSTLTVSRGKRSTAGLEGTWPQVNLLPPEVTAARGLRHVKQWLGVVLLLVFVVVGAGYAYGTVTRSNADAELVDAQEAGARREAQMSQYSEVLPLVQGLKNTTEARTYVMAPEVQWKQYLDAIASVLPGNSRITNIAVSQATVTLAPPAVADDLTQQGIASVQFTAFVPAVTDSAALEDALNGIPGFHDASIASDALGELDAANGYTLTGAVQIDDSALANRFPAAEGN